MHFIDHTLIMLLFVALPFYSAYDSRRYLAGIAAGQPADPVRIYLGSIVMLWTILAALAIAWWTLGRPVTDLGFRRLEGLQLWGGLSTVVVMTGSMAYSWRTIARASEKEKAKQAEGLGDLVHYLPRTSRELRYLMGASITAGIVEEIVYRGFVLWYLGSVMPLWIAVALSSVGFGLGHLYQGGANAVRAGLIGLGFAVYYVLTGSIWLPIVAHIAFDMLQGLMTFELLRKNNHRPEA